MYNLALYLSILFLRFFTSFSCNYLIFNKLQEFSVDKLLKIRELRKRCEYIVDNQRVTVYNRCKRLISRVIAGTEVTVRVYTKY